MLEGKNFKSTSHSYEVCCFLELSNFNIYVVSPNYSFRPLQVFQCRSQWPLCLGLVSASARLLGLRFEVLPWAWLAVCCECCVLSGEVLAKGRSLVQRNATECSVSECDCEASIKGLLSHGNNFYPLYKNCLFVYKGVWKDHSDADRFILTAMYT